jgi:hypothetical protein
MADPVIVADVCSLTLRSSEQPAYDQPFELQDLYMTRVRELRWPL